MKCLHYLLPSRVWIGSHLATVGWLLGIWTLLSGCVTAPPLATPLPPATPVVSAVPASFPPLTLYAAGLQPEHAHLLDSLAHLSRYEIDVQLFPVLHTLWGYASIAVVNSSPDAWPYLVFRLPANLPRLDAMMQILSIHVEGQPVVPATSGSPTVLILPLDTPLAPGHGVQVDLEWFLQYSHGNDDPQSYILMGSNQDMISLPYFYPELAVYAPEAPGTTHGWWTTEIPEYADIRFAPAALMRVTATLPEQLVVAGSGHHMETVPLSEGRLRHEWITGPVRGFVLQASPSYVTATLEVDGTILKSYHHAADDTVARTALAQAASALRAFESNFGPYPYADLSIVVSPLNRLGMEYSNLIQIGIQRYRDFGDNTAYIIAHEVAHMWFYLMVHNDPVHHIGLDEGLATLAFIFYMEEIQGNYDRKPLVAYWRSRVHNAASSYTGDNPWWLESSYENIQHYYSVNYRRAAVFLDALWTLAGDEAFRDVLQAYVEQHRFQIVAPHDLMTAFATAVDADRLAELERAWWSENSPLP